MDDCSTLLHAKVVLLEKMYTNTLDQEDAIQKKDESIFAKLVELRNGIMKEIDQIDLEIKQSMSYGQMDEEEWELLKKGMEDLLEKIQQRDQKNYQQAEKYRQELKKSISLMDQGRKAITDGYFKSYAQTYGYFVDRKIGK